MEQRKQVYILNPTDPIRMLRYRPSAIARLAGSPHYPRIRGMVRFFQTHDGVIVHTHILGLPKTESIYAFHIHNGPACTGNNDDPFADAGTHYNPDNQPHPYHAGDLPPVFNADGQAFFMVLTNRFSVREVIGKTIILHASPDDFTTQPSGNAGEKIACGVITTG